MNESYIDIDLLTNWAGNYNDGDIGYIAENIRVYGYNRSVSVWQDGIVMAGNHTLKALKWLKQQGNACPSGNIEERGGKWFIQYSSCAHLSESEARDYAIADNESAKRSLFDDEILGLHLREIAKSDEENRTNRLERLGFEQADIVDMLKRAGVIDNQEPPTNHEKRKDDKTAGEQALEILGVELGDIYAIKSPEWGITHYLMCGDAFNEQARARLLNGTTPDILHGDPPYGNDLLDQRGGSRITGKSQNYDYVMNNQDEFDPRPLLNIAPQVILWGANHYANRLPNSAFWLVWDKQGGAKEIDFANVELAWCNMSKPARMLTHIWDGFRRDSEKGETRIHVNQKPTAVIRWALEYLEGRVVFIPFAGSGSEILATDELGRQAYAMDINPKIVSAALIRLQEKGFNIEKLAP